MEMVVEPDQCAGTTVCAIRLDHLPGAGDPLPAVCLDELASGVSEHLWCDDVDASDRFALFDRCTHRSLLHVNLAVIANHEAQCLGTTL